MCVCVRACVRACVRGWVGGWVCVCVSRCIILHLVLTSCHIQSCLRQSQSLRDNKASLTACGVFHRPPWKELSCKAQTALAQAQQEHGFWYVFVQNMVDNMFFV